MHINTWWHPVNSVKFHPILINNKVQFSKEHVLWMKIKTAGNPARKRVTNELYVSQNTKTFHPRVLYFDPGTSFYLKNQNVGIVLPLEISYTSGNVDTGNVCLNRTLWWITSLPLYYMHPVWVAFNIFVSWRIDDNFVNLAYSDSRKEHNI